MKYILSYVVIPVKLSTWDGLFYQVDSSIIAYELVKNN